MGNGRPLFNIWQYTFGHVVNEGVLKILKVVEFFFYDVAWV